jgi:two-component system alkaline phosphatase synthesis response regulator PhoP
MTTDEMRILLVDDEHDITQFLSYNLKKEGFQVYVANNGHSAIDIANDVNPDLIILDVMMPGMDGIETCERIRKTPGIHNSMIVFLTARSEDYSQIAGFEAGGDDYITKPIRPKVFITRIKALLKRARSYPGKDIVEDNLISVGDIIIDPERFQVRFKGEEVVLPRKEFYLLRLLSSKPNKVFTREEIFSKVWGENVLVSDRTIDVYIRKLREKFGQKVITTVKGVGYRLESIPTD